MKRISTLRSLMAGMTAMLTASSLWADAVKVGELYFDLNAATQTATLARNAEYKALTTLTVPGTITVDNQTYTVKAVAQQAFQDCASLTSVEFEEGVEDIGMWAFYSCTGIRELHLPSTLTRVQDSGFSRCSSIETLVLPDNLTEIGSFGFGTLSSLTSLTLPANMTELKNNAFASCSKLTEINFNNASVTISGNAFASSGMTTLVVPSNVVIGSGAFSRSSRLASVTFSEGVQEVGESAFYECNALASVTIPSTMKTIGGNAFYNCRAIEEISLPESLEKIDGMAFYGCSALKTVTWPSSVQRMENATFYECAGLQSITLPATMESIGNMAFQGCSNLASITLPEGIPSIGEGLFNGCASLTSVNIPSSVTSIGQNAFRSSGLTRIDIPEGTTSIGDAAFVGCDRLEGIHVASGNSAYADIDGVLTDKEKHTLLAFPGGKEGEYTMPESIQTINGWSFMQNSNLTAIHFSPNLKEIGPSAFYQCGALTSLEFPESLTSIGASAFMFASAVQSVRLPNSDLFIGSNAFGGTGVTSMIFPETITEIGIGQDETFSVLTMCSSLRWVSLPSSLTAFSPLGLYCNSLTTIYSFAVNPPAISGENMATGEFTIKVPKGSAEAYTAAWSTLYPNVTFEEVLPVGPSVEVSQGAASLQWETYSDENFAAPSRYTVELTEGETVVVNASIPSDQISGSSLSYQFENLDKGEFSYDLKGYVSTGEMTLHYTGSFEVKSSGIEKIETQEEENSPVFYTLQGIRVENPASGVFIKVQGDKASKVQLP